MKYIKKHKENEVLYKVSLYISFSFFIIILIWFISFKTNNIDHIIYNYNILKTMSLIERLKYDIIPFVFNNPYINGLKEFIYNILIFIPFGIYLPLLFGKKNFLKYIFITFLISLTLELIQLITMIGGFSTNDLISNTLGFIIGYLLYIAIVQFIQRKTIFIFYSVINILLFPIIIYLIIDIIKTVDILIIYLK